MNNQRYEILTPLAQGQKSDCYHGRDQITHKEVFIKGQQYYGTGLSIEKEILMGIQHPNLPLLLDVFYEKDREYIVTQWIEGVTLKKLMIENPLSEAQLVAYFYQLCQAVAYLHHHPLGIVHGDISLGNIIINKYDQLLLIDFDVSHCDRFTVDKIEGKGTIGYAAPEVLLMPEMAGRSMDIYGIGACIKTVLKANPTIYSMELAYISKKAMAIQVDHRYKDVEELKEDLCLLL